MTNEQIRNIATSIEEAMNLARKDEAMGILEWVHKFKVNRIPSGGWAWFIDVECYKFTTSELYTKYIEYINSLK